MTKIFAAFFRLPFEAKTFCVVESGPRIVWGTSVTIAPESELIGINITEFMLSVDSASDFPTAIFDLNSARRMLIGKPRSDYKSGSEPWLGVQAIGKFFNSTDHLAKIRALEADKFGSYEDWLASLIPGWESELISSIKSAYSSFIEEMRSSNLLEMFEKCEMPLSRHFGISGRNGISLDSSQLDCRLKELDNQYFTSVKTLELTYDYFSTGFDSIPNAEEIITRVPEMTPADFSKKYFWESVEFQKSMSPFLDALYVEHITRRDKNELLRIRNAIGDICKISYDVFGTVSGRILVTRPGIQYLKRNSRGIFKPRAGKCFLYGDFAQFEPGILAFLSGDSLLQGLYNNGDVYNGLATVIGAACDRKVAKEIFLSFIYGMKKENISRKIQLSYGEEQARNVDTFFNQFKGIELWKRNLINSCRKSLKCQGISGYTRFFDSNDSDSELERWAPNHMIQSTASGIFKTALTRLIPEIPYGRLLIPMHDAILVEIPSSRFDDAKSKIEQVMISSFEEICTGIKCRVKFEDFA